MNPITIKDYMEVVGYRITEGSEFLWKCFGLNSYSLDCWNGDHNGYSVGIVFDNKNGTVYKFEAHDYAKEKSYRWVHPQWVDQYATESKNRGIDHKQAWDHVQFIDLDHADDILEKATAIVNGEEYDERVMIELDLPQDLLLQLYQLAHQQDITLNQLVEKIIRSEIENRKNAA